MAPKRRTTAKVKRAVSSAAAPKTRRRKKTSTARKTVRAARSHTATISHNRRRGTAVYGERRHTYTDHRSDSYKHYSSIMKTVILFLAFVLALAILANIFAPTINNRPINHRTSQSFLDMRGKTYNTAAEDVTESYKYTIPNHTIPSVPSVPPA